MSAKYTALTPIQHDGKRYEEGQDVPLSAAEATPLLAAGAVQEAKADKPKAKDDTPKAKDDAPQAKD